MRSSADACCKKYKNELFLPYLLKPLDAKYADSQLRAFDLLDQTIGDYEAKTPLPRKVAKKFAFNNLKSKVQRKLIYDYIHNHSPYCSHATRKGGKVVECKNRLKPDKTTHIGHIFSQNWCTAYSVFQESMNHPDNLYLSCSSCNTSLNLGCPSKDVLKRINKEGLTLGDLIRKGYLK